MQNSYTYLLSNFLVSCSNLELFKIDSNDLLRRRTTHLSCVMVRSIVNCEIKCYVDVIIRMDCIGGLGELENENEDHC